MHEILFNSYDPSKPFWVIGPSSKVSDYKDFILNNLKEANTITIGHCLHELTKNWDFNPTFHTWYDAHQTLKLLLDFESGETEPLSYCYNTVMVPPHFVEVQNRYSGLGTKKRVWDRYFKLIQYLKSNPNINYQPIKALNIYDACRKNIYLWKHQSKHQKDIQKAIDDPEFRFLNKDFMFCGTGPGLENILSRLIFPTLFKLKAKNVFLLGFDGCHGRFYEHQPISLDNRPASKVKHYLANGWPSYINPNHKMFLHLEKWVEWQPFHNMHIYNVQEDTPLRDKLNYLSPEDALKK